MRDNQFNTWISYSDIMSDEQQQDTDRTPIQITEEFRQMIDDEVRQIEQLGGTTDKVCITYVIEHCAILLIYVILCAA